MKEEAQGYIEKLRQEISAWPEKEQHALVWIAKHYNLAVDICNQEVLSEEQREQFMREAMEKDDALLMLFVLLESSCMGK